MSTPPQSVPPPLWTADLPGIGGRIKVEPTDFDVEEIPAYECSGQGDFLFLWIEKRSMGAEHFTRELARRLEIRPGDIGTAGLKDRHAVTRQMVSVPAVVDDRLSQIEGDGIRLLKVDRHGNKLRPGHLRGNRFNILVRDVVPDALPRAENIVQRIREAGLPNFYGPQRFGHDDETLRGGWALLRGEPPPVGSDGRSLNVRSPFLRKLALSAVQSALFNAYLAKRLADGLMRSVTLGDVMAKWPVGGMFVAQDVVTEQARLDRREIVPTGPIFGKKMFPAAEQAADREQRLLQEHGIDLNAFRQFGKLLLGTRRHNLIYIDDLAVNTDPMGIRLACTLPAGSYATILLTEFMKTDTTTNFE